MQLPNAHRHNAGTCEDFRGSLLDAIDAGRRSRPLRRHMRHCEECSSLWKGLREDQRALKALAPPSPLMIYWLILSGRTPNGGPPSGGGGLGRLTTTFATGVATVAAVSGVIVGSGVWGGSPGSSLPKQQVVQIAGLNQGEVSPAAVVGKSEKKSSSSGTDKGGVATVLKPGSSSLVSGIDSPGTSSAPSSPQEEGSSEGQNGSSQNLKRVTVKQNDSATPSHSNSSSGSGSSGGTQQNSSSGSGVAESNSQSSSGSEQTSSGGDGQQTVSTQQNNVTSTPETKTQVPLDKKPDWKKPPDKPNQNGNGQQNTQSGATKTLTGQPLK